MQTFRCRTKIPRISIMVRSNETAYLGHIDVCVCVCALVKDNR